MNIRNDKEQLDFSEFQIECGRCSGLCCVALYCAKTDGFPQNKEAGKPCKNLLHNFLCKIHGELVEKKMKGCLSFHCLGAGSRVTEVFCGQNWRTTENQNLIFEIFLLGMKLQQMKFCLQDLRTLFISEQNREMARSLSEEIEGIWKTVPLKMKECGEKSLMERVGAVLIQASEEIQIQILGKVQKEKEKLYLGKDFRNEVLTGRNFSGTFLIEANLEGLDLTGTNFGGADIRGMNLKNANLRDSIFLNQMQLNGTIGNKHTQIPYMLKRPETWEK